MNITNDPEATWTTLSDKWPVGPLVDHLEILDIAHKIRRRIRYEYAVEEAMKELSELYEQRIAELKKSITQ